MSTERQWQDHSTPMGPEHAAIVLSDEPSTSPIRAGNDPDVIIDATLPVPEQPFTMHPEGSSSTLGTIRRRFAELAGRIDELDDTIARVGAYAPMSTSPRRHAPGPSGPRSPAELPPAGPSRPTIIPLLARRNASSNEASTSLGRRVEARARVGGSATSNDLRTDFREFMETSDSSLSLLSQHGQELVASARAFRQSMASAQPSSSSSTLNPSANTTADTATRRWRSALWRHNLRDRRPRDPEGTSGIVISQRSNQGESVPNVVLPPTLQVIGRPRSGSTADVLPPTLQVIGRPRSGSTADTPDPEDEIIDPASRRSYRIRRRLNPEGGAASQWRVVELLEDEDDGQALTSSSQRNGPQQAELSSIPGWSDYSSLEDEVIRPGEGDDHRVSQPRSYLLSPNYFLERDRSRSFSASEQLTRSQLSSTSIPGRRRRGWARLDADGNEISTDEEEEYERNRSHMRVRAQALAAQHLSGRSVMSDRLSEEPPVLPPPPIPNAWIVPGPISSGEDHSADNPYGVDYVPRSPVFRVRLNSRSPVSSTASTVTANYDEPSQDIAPTVPSTPLPSPYQPNLLPWAPLDLSPVPRSPGVEFKGPSSRERRSTFTPYAGR
ncbi:hypothetical protein BDW22DRAFT_1483196 [Trametopsis cervina]|nr:hypothetical protein BDW22DRAFT_1483196 [Trametopsis cervina]